MARISNNHLSVGTSERVSTSIVTIGKIEAYFADMNDEQLARAAKVPDAFTGR